MFSLLILDLDNAFSLSLTITFPENLLKKMLKIELV
jgi:hypothetical protein